MDSSSAGSLIKAAESTVLRSWVQAQLAHGRSRELLSEAQVREQSRSFLATFAAAASQNIEGELTGPHWDDVRAALTGLSKSRASTGFSPAETAAFVFSLKQPLFDAVRSGFGQDTARANEQALVLSELIDRLGLLTVDAYQQGRDEVIMRQQQELLDLSTPVIKLWEGIVAVPLIGTLDSERTQVVMESLLEAIVHNEATIAIIDITGVPTVDTLVAQHLLKAVAAARLMGAECIISGIRPQIAQTIVHLGVDLGDVVTKSTLADALKVALSKCSLAIRPARTQAGA